jgi:16S rRNA processing protein RimM
MNTEDKLMEMGICFKPHGIRGGFTFVLSNNEDSCLKKGTKVTLFPKKSESSISEEGENFTIEKIQHGNKVIVFFKGITDRNIVEAMIPFSVMIPRSEFPETSEDEYYLSDLIGLDVYDEETSEKIGNIKDFYDNSAQIVLIISGKNELIEVPFIEQFVPEVDIENNKVSIIIPEIIE